MFKRVILILICFLIFADSHIFAQTKITLDATSLPKDFEGHDAEILVKNLNALLKSAKGKNAPSIKGKRVYEKLTVDDLFAFTLDAAEYVAGRNASNNLRYRGAIFPLRSLNETPPPRLHYTDLTGYGVGSGDPGFSSINELAPKFSDSQSLETLWTNAYLPIKTIYAPESLAKKYVGKKAACRPSSYSPDVQVCDGRDFNVPSPQIHYGISFVKTQPFSLVKVTDENLSLQTYKFARPTMPGIVAWLENGEQYSGGTAPIFIVRLVAPYLESKNYETPDAVERKPHQDVRKILYAELAGIWIYDRQSGKILSKNGEKAIVPDAVSGKEDQSADLKIDAPVGEKNALSDTPLKIISKPRHYYTEVAKKNNVTGTVKLKVTFLASGQIGAIAVVEGLPDGLTEEAVKAARGIRFSPAVVNGVPRTVAKVVTYTFTIY